MKYTRNHWLEDTVRLNRFKAAYVLVAILAVSFAIASWTLFIDRVSESRLIVNCASFTSVVDATNFAKTHPEYAKRLDPKGKLSACSSYDYGTTN